MSFVHLHVHSQYSLLEATSTIKALVKKAAEDKMPALALTDNGNMFAAAEFYFACKAHGIKPIIGIDAYLAPRGRLVKGEEREFSGHRRLVLLAQNAQGYRNLCRLSSIGFQQGFYYKPRIDHEVLKEFGSGLIALSAGPQGEVAWQFLQHGVDAGLAKIGELQALFPGRFYLELCRTGVPEWRKLEQFYLEASARTGCPVVATNDVYYLEPEDQLPQEVLVCIGSNKTLRDESRWRLGSSQFYFKTASQMRELFRDLPEASAQTLQIAEQVDFEFQLKDESGKAIYHLPTYPTASGLGLKEEIQRLAREGLQRRFEQASRRGEPVSELAHPGYFQRLDYELSVIDKMGFNGYFLIVQDFIGWAKQNDIPVGPGRGSGAGSLVAYSLGITDLDPVEHGLVFERFLNPERVSMPDFDIDFCQERRGEVIDYVTGKYGEASVSQIITFGKLQARAAIRDVGRVLGMTYAEVDKVSKLIPEKLGITLREAIEMEPRLREQMEIDPQVATLMDLAQRIEGLVRHAGIHAAGVIIADGKLVEHAPLYRGVDGENVIQYDMKHAEKLGLIKFDFLGLKTLTLIHQALAMIERNHQKKLAPSDIPLSDPGIYEIMTRGDTAGIFQFESEGITAAIRDIKPTCFADITAINALYRPGPMDMISEFARRKRGESPVEYLFAELEEILRETYGIIVYQEQVQLIAARIANFSLGEADLLRRAMGKKIPQEMDQQRSRFLAGAKAGGFDEQKSAQLFDLMAEFANYGFNKSHAAAYCVIAAQTAWLKKHYPVEFYSALLSTEMGDTDKVVKYVKDAVRRGLRVSAPSVQHSDYKFYGRGDIIYFSLGAIKGVGEAAVLSLLAARAELPEKKFLGLQHFFEAVDGRKLNRKTIECLIKAGALDDFNLHRAALMANYPQMVERAEGARVEREMGQVSLFSLVDAQSQGAEVQLTQVEPWSRARQLASEKEVLGFYLSDHPLNGLEGFYKSWITTDLSGLGHMAAKKRVILCGLVSELRELITKKGTRMAFAKFEDSSAQTELVIFPDVYAKVEAALKSDRPLVVAGPLEKENDSHKVIVDSLTPLDEMNAKAKTLVLHLDDSMAERLPQLRRLVERYPGATDLCFELELAEPNTVVTLSAISPGGVAPTTEFIESAQNLFIRKDFFEMRN